MSPINQPASTETKPSKSCFTIELDLLGCPQRKFLECIIHARSIANATFSAHEILHLRSSLKHTISKSIRSARPAAHRNRTEITTVHARHMRCQRAWAYLFFSPSHDPVNLVRWNTNTRAQADTCTHIRRHARTQTPASGNVVQLIRRVRLSVSRFRLHSRLTTNHA